MRARLTAVLTVVSLCAACSGSANATTAPTTTTGTGTETFASFLAIGGSSAHTFHVSQAGTITVTLTTVPSAAVVGLGAGVPNASGSGCSLTNSLDASAGTDPQLTIPATVGSYCVEVYDSGQLVGIGTAFSVTIAHP